MRTITFSIVLVALFAFSLTLFGQVSTPTPGIGNPLGPLVSGTDF